MKNRLVYLPFFVYSISFLSILVLYQFGWSDLYPRLNGFVLSFILISSFISFLFAFLQAKKLRLNLVPLELNSSFIKKSIWFLAIGYLLDFAYERTIPLLRTLSDPSYSYDNFKGLPTFHVILGTFNIFFSILMFDNYLSNKSRKKLILFLGSLVPYVLVMNRGAFMIVFSAMIFLYLMRIPKINYKSVVRSILILVSILYLFGLVGNIRQPQTKAEKEYLLRVGGASDRFINSGIPSEFYWSYMYLISPLGNFQNMVDKKADDFDTENTGLFVTTQLFPDFISKRLISIFNYDDIVYRAPWFDYLVSPLFNAPTTYFVSYFLMGSFGVLIMFIAIILSNFIYPLMFRKNSRYRLTAIASLNAIILLSTFNNMWFATGTILFWPLILGFVERTNFK